jgi:hypothetical protein
MEDLQIRRRRIDRNDERRQTFPVSDSAEREIDFDSRNRRQRDLVIDRILMIESDLLAFALWVLRGRRRFPLAVTVGRATTPSARPHEILVAGDAATPDKGSQH